MRFPSGKRYEQVFYRGRGRKPMNRITKGRLVLWDIMMEGPLYFHWKFERKEGEVQKSVVKY
jgi:hypothetical protein